MLRVNKAHPCPICEKSDWCLVAEDGTAAICARVSDGAQKKCGDAGYLHILKADDRRTKAVHRIHRTEDKTTETPDFDVLAKRYQDRVSRRQLAMLGRSLGITTASLIRLGVGWDKEAFTFPMCDERMRIIGIRRRLGNGRKLCVTGSQNGLFIPSGLSNDKPLMVCEGPTDTAAALDLAFSALGRPNCNSLIKMTALAVKDYKEIVIVADNDTAGKAGAKKLASYLTIHCPRVKVLYPPEGIKDLRQWLGKGLTTAYLRRVIEKIETAKVQVKIKD